MLDLKIVSFVVLIIWSSVNGQTNNLNIMVATGFYDGDYLDDTEVIDAETLTSCPNKPAKYPVKMKEGVTVQHNSKMVICGGYNDFNTYGDCYSYSNNTWNIEAFKLEPVRSGAMSAEVRPGEWLVMGGYDGSNMLSDSLLLKNGIFTQGPNLPEVIYGGSCVMLNQTYLFVAAGQSLQNYFLDVNTEQWTPIARRTLAQSFLVFHSSGTFYNYTIGEIQIANIGSEYIEVYSPRDDSWHPLSFPVPFQSLYRSAAIQNGTDSFIMIGGYTDEDIFVDFYNEDMFLMNHKGLSVLKQDVLQTGRQVHVAMSISKNDFTCI